MNYNDNVNEHIRFILRSNHGQLRVARLKLIIFEQNRLSEGSLNEGIPFMHHLNSVNNMELKLSFLEFH